MLHRPFGPSLKAEVVDAGKLVRAFGVHHVEQAISDGWLPIARPTAADQRLSQRLRRTTSLGDGEIEALSLAQGRQCLVVLDDKEARTVAQALGLRYLGTAGVLLQAYRRKHLSLGEFEDAISDLTRVLWLSPSVVAQILKRAREEA